MAQPRIDIGSWTQKGKNAKEAIGKAWSKFFHIAGVPGRQADSPYFFHIVFVCMIINYCFGRVIYIKMCIVNAEISFYFTPWIHFLSVKKLHETTGIPAKPAGKPEFPAGIPLRTGTHNRPVYWQNRPVNRYNRPVYRSVSPHRRNLNSNRVLSGINRLLLQPVR